MKDLYDYLADIMPIKIVLLSLTVGLVSLSIVFISGLISEGVRIEIIAERAFSAFSFSSLTCFIVMMLGEEFAIFKSNSEIEKFINNAQIEDFADDFNRAEYLSDENQQNQFITEDEPAIELENGDSFLPNQS